MKIYNKTKKTTISDKAKQCISLFSKARGLMFSKQNDLIFVENNERNIPLHMWFVFYQIDVLYLNKDKKVIEIKENFLPFTFYFPKNKAKYIIELKKGAVSASKTAIMDHLQFD